MLTEKQIQTAESIQLSTNFNLYELIKSDSYPELVDYPSELIIEKLKEYANTVLQPIRDKFGRLRINSGYRPKRLNAAVGGVSNSIHQILTDPGHVYLGCACDIVPLDADIIEVFEWAAANVQTIRTIILYRKPSVTKNPFIHADNRLATGKPISILEKTGKNKYEPYVKES